MKANELRIGNWVKIVSGQWVKIEFVNPSDDSLSSFYPIPLTPEILEKACGFAKSSEFDVWNGLNHHLSIEYAYGGYRWYIDDVGNNEGSHPRKIKHLHQLQNLYFALTGQELTINL